MASHESDKPPPTLYSISIGLLAGGVAGGVCVPSSEPSIMTATNTYLIKGALLACRSRTAVAPIERLKILMQVQGNDQVYRNMWQVRDNPQPKCQPSLGCFAGLAGVDLVMQHLRQHPAHFVG